MPLTLFSDWRDGEVAVIGLGKSGRAAAMLLATHGVRVYASDAGTSDAARSAADALRAIGVHVETGGHSLDRIRNATAVVASPGVPPSAPPLVAAREANVPIVGELEVALRAMPDLRYIAVTGTNGKTTTTALVGHLLRALGYNAIDAGNIGTPLAEVALAEHQPDWVALEMSSFQLHDTPSVRPTVGVVTNLSPDHLDRYASVDEYYADKALLFRNATRNSKWVLNADDQETLALPSRLPDAPSTLPGVWWSFSTGGEDADAFYDREDDELVIFGRPLIARDELQLFGDHNVANALAAALAVTVADDAHRTDQSRDAMAEGLRTFRALKHRLEVVGEFDGVLWINDSKATNVSSTLVAVQGMTRPTVLLLGGRHKGEPYTALAEPIREHVKQVIAYGEAGPIVAQDLDGVVPIDLVRGSFEDVMNHAREAAVPGDVVLLSPACSSYDMFNNYEERGATFKRLAASGGSR